MDAYKYYLIYNDVKTEIIEPIGWDGYESQMSRNENYHGISAEYSGDEIRLRFDEQIAIDIIEKAYKDDLTNKITFVMEYEGSEEFRGQMDFESYADVFANFRYIEVAVSEIDERVTFNNRVSQKVDLDSLVSFDGVSLPTYPHLKQKITLPGKDIFKTSQLNDKNTDTIQNINSSRFYAQPSMNETTFGELDAIYTVDAMASGNLNDIRQNVFFRNFVDNKSKNRDYKLSLKFNGRFRIGIVGGGGTYIQALNFVVERNGQTIYFQPLYKEGTISSIDFEISIENKPIENLLSQESLVYYFEVTTSNNIDNCYFDEKDLELKITAINSFPDTEAELTFLHEAFARTTEIITNNQLTVKSEYLGRPDSDIFPTQGYSIGSLHSITNGLRIRNYTDTGGNKPKFEVSFEQLIKAFIPVDVLGYGISYENGRRIVRIEPIEWFYQDHIIFEINNPSGKRFSLYRNNVFSYLKTGYKKYETGDVGGLDAVMTEREYRTRQDLIANVIDSQSEFIADSYAIEYTRRKTIEKDTTDWRYDNDYFIIELNIDVDNNSYKVDQGAVSASNVISFETIYNARISPSRSAEKWTKYMFGWSKDTETLIYAAGTGNINASITPNPIYGTGITFEEKKENQDLISLSQIYKSETLQFDYPLSPSEHKKIKEDPYGIILVDGEEYYLIELKYKYRSAIGTFTLMKKY